MWISLKAEKAEAVASALEAGFPDLAKQIREEQERLKTTTHNALVVSAKEKYEEEGDAREIRVDEDAPVSESDDHAHVRALIRRLAFHRDKLVTQNATATARVLCYENDVAVHNDTYGSKWYAFNKRTQQYAIRPGVWSDSCGDIGLFDTREDAEQAAVTALTAQSKEGLE